ncbi:MAG: hypothetical protein DRG82_00380 [Deltaproteobacteria bacterium]|nr:MAG: hypothetical protein DRG82_00380 [Deltaproteobacteria bacterium]
MWPTLFSVFFITSFAVVPVSQIIPSSKTPSHWVKKQRDKAFPCLFSGKIRHLLWFSSKFIHPAPIET